MAAALNLAVALDGGERIVSVQVCFVFFLLGIEKSSTRRSGGGEAGGDGGPDAATAAGDQCNAAGLAK
jgi:hypothetical protein